MAETHVCNLSRQTIPQLQELLERQAILMRNKKLLERLKDKGESVKKLHDKIQKEISHRKNVECLQDSLQAISISDNAEFLRDKHVEYVCSKEKPLTDTRYRPHRTLIQKETKRTMEKSPNKYAEVTAACEPKLVHEPPIFIPLSESLVIENNQAVRVMEEQAKNAFSRLHMESYVTNNVTSFEEDDIQNEVEF